MRRKRNLLRNVNNFTLHSNHLPKPDDRKLMVTFGFDGIKNVDWLKLTNQLYYLWYDCLYILVGTVLPRITFWLTLLGIYQELYEMVIYARLLCQQRDQLLAHLFVLRESARMAAEESSAGGTSLGLIGKGILLILVVLVIIVVAQEESVTSTKSQ